MPEPGLALRFAQVCKWLSGGNDFIANRKPDQFTQRGHIELTHDVGAMRLNGPDAYAEGRRNFLVGLPLHQKLNDLSFTRAQAGAWAPAPLGRYVRFPIALKDMIGNLGREKWLMPHQRLNG